MRNPFQQRLARPTLTGARLAATFALLLIPALAAARSGREERRTEGQEKLLRGWPLDADGGIRIHNHAGSIRLIGWSRDSVAVRGTVAPGMSFFGGGSRRGIKFGVEGFPTEEATPTVLTAYVPANAAVYVRGAATDIVVEGLSGSVDLSTVNGRVRVMGDPRELLVEVMDGELEILGSPGVLRAKTAGATLRWTGTSGDATLGSVSGRIEVLRGPIGHGRIETISGDILLDALLRPDADLVIESHSGSVELRSSANVPTRITVDAARVSGEGISSSSGIIKGKRLPPRTLELAGAVAEGGAAEVTVRSFKGEFRLLAPAPPR